MFFGEAGDQPGAAQLHSDKHRGLKENDFYDTQWSEGGRTFTEAGKQAADNIEHDLDQGSAQSEDDEVLLFTDLAERPVARQTANGKKQADPEQRLHQIG